MPPPKLAFPKIRRVQLREFSLYTLQPNLDIEIPKGVFCLAGANGLGKSTFLAAVNFALTGFVPDPKRDYLSSDDYYKHHRHESGFTEAFFTGRIKEDDRETAEISLHLEVGGVRCKITRGIFSPPGLREFSVVGPGTAQTLSWEDGTDGLEIERGYQEWLVGRVGLDKFEQYAFLQHLVLTFDESRHLLMWDRPALNDALFLAIGGDASRAAQATKLRREMDRAGSRARNIQFQATNVRGRINTIREELGDGTEPSQDGVMSPEDAAREHRAVQERLEAQQEKVTRKWNELRDAELAWAQASARHSALRDEYAREFSLHVHKRSRVELHPIVAATLSEDECAVCGTEHVHEAVQERIGEGTCPLCGSGLPEQAPPSESIRRLQSIDEEMAAAQSDLDTAAATKARVSKEAQAADARLQAINAEMQEFEEANRRALLALASGGEDNVASTLKRLREELEDLLRQKREKYDERDAKRRQLVKLQRELNEQYALAEEEFVPLLQRLAKSFLGVDLYVRASSSEAISTLGLSLELEMRGSTRRENFQLSESQGFFLDIALRMALAQYMSEPGSEAVLFIDTPEGSLDIAYEARAGLMFAHFVQAGHDLLMTANINSSQLLRRLAHECGRERMTLHRMTSWTELSDVQLEEEELFTMAYEEIEEALGPVA
jgi:DNA repair exonuclease SbcCD ATPase subunit